MQIVKPVTLVCMLVLFGSLLACAPRDAGFESVQVLLQQRAGLETQWSYLDGPTDATVVEMLAQPVGPEEAVRIALLNNRDLQASFEELEIARASLLEASLPPNIELDFDSHPVEGERSEFSFAATIDLSRLLFLSMRRGVASAELDAVRFQTTGTLLGFAQAVRTAYYDYQAAEQLLELNETVLEAAAASYDVAQRLHQAGNIAALELANEQAFYEESRSQIALSEAVAFSRREELNALMGLSGVETHWQLAGRLSEPQEDSPDLADLEARAIEQSLDLVELEHRYMGAARSANLARAEGLLPSLRAGVHMDRDEGLREFGPVISLDLPVFNQGQAGVALARAEMRQLEQQYRARAIRIRAAVRTARNNLLIAVRRVNHYQDVLLPLREQIVEQTQRQYNAMDLGVFQLIVARQDQVRTAQEYVLALREYWHARATLDQILAGRLVSAEVDLGTMAGDLEMP
jgi:cobalt-zinc-cadmium efflux system outer membrane protein